MCVRVCLDGFLKCIIAVSYVIPFSQLGCAGMWWYVIIVVCVYVEILNFSIVNIYIHTGSLAAHMRYLDVD